MKKNSGENKTCVCVFFRTEFNLILAINLPMRAVRIYTVNLPEAITFDRAHDGGGASPK